MAWFKASRQRTVYATLIVTFGFRWRGRGPGMAPTLADRIA
jgi:hypothetical protein